MQKLRKQKKARGLIFFLSLVFIGLLSGCQSQTATDKSKNEEISLIPTVAPTDELEPTTSLPEVTDGSGMEEDGLTDLKPTVLPDDSIIEPRLEDFSLMEEYYKDYSFDVIYDEELDYYERVYTIHGEYDLNGDGVLDTIKAELMADYSESTYIEINGVRTNMQMAYPSGEVRIIDIDNTDNYSEVAIYDNGPSGDYTVLFFRYDGNKPEFVGEIDQLAMMDGKGKFISWFHRTNYFEPQFFSAWGEFIDGKYVVTNHDVEQYIGETYEVNGTAFFVPMEENPTNYFEHTSWDFESQREFEGVKIRLLDIHIDSEDRILNWFYVELPEGERGLLYFWIGD